MDATLKDPTIIKKMIESIKELVNETNVELLSTGINIQALDTSHIALVVVNLEQTGFDSYTCDKALTIGVNLKSLSTILRFCDSEDTLRLHTDEDGSKLAVEFENKDSTRSKKFVLNLLQIETESLTIPESTYDVKLSLNSSEFAKLCKDCYLLADTVIIEATKDEVVFRTEGEAGKLRTVFDGSKCEIKEEVKQSFSLRYLCMFSKAAACAAEVDLYISSSAPLIVSYPIEKQGELKFFLAPKVNEEHK